VAGLSPTELVGVAVSGGADSVYLLLALWADEALRPRLRVLHYNHRVRGEVADGDATFVQALCSVLDVPCVVGERSAQGWATEAELRAARLEFFAQQRSALGLRVIATAHHLDDVVETMLMRLARGAGLAGLAAPREWQAFRAGHVHWRPLIGARLTKAELLAALSAGAIPWHGGGCVTLARRCDQPATHRGPQSCPCVGGAGWGGSFGPYAYPRLWRICPPPG
jgi:tRNA(Ile)-lysidine synthase